MLYAYSNNIFSNSLISSFHAIIFGLDSKLKVVSFESNIFNMPVFKREKVGINFFKNLFHSNCYINQQIVMILDIFEFN